MRQSIINGISRNEFFISKLTNVVLLSAFATLYYIFITLLIGFYHGEDVGLRDAFSNDHAVGRFFLMSFSYMNFAMFLAFLIRKSGIAVFFYLTYVMIIELILRYLVHMKIHASVFVNYYPMNATEDLMPFPLFKYAQAVPTDIEFSFLLSYKEAVITTLIYSLIFLAVSYLNFKRRDI